MIREKGFDRLWILASKIKSFEVLGFLSLTMYFLADILFVVITVVPFGISSVLQSKESLFKESVINCIFVGEGHSCAAPKEETLTAAISVCYV